MATRSEDELRIFPRRDRLLILFVLLELIAFPLVPLGPVAVAGAALATSLRQSHGRMLALWILSGVLAAIVIAPFVLSFFRFALVEVGPVHEVGPVSTGYEVNVGR